MSNMPNTIAFICVLCLIAVNCRPTAVTPTDIEEGGSGIGSSIPKDSEVQKTKEALTDFQLNIDQDQDYLGQKADQKRKRIAEKLKRTRGASNDGTIDDYFKDFQY